MSDNCIGEEFEKVISSETYCVDSCHGSEKIYIHGENRRCLNACSEITGVVLYEKGDYCVDQNECKFYKGTKCLDSCLTEENGYNYHNYEEKECLRGCTGINKYSDEVNKICCQTDNCPYINENNNRCLFSCEINEGFYIDSNDPDSTGKICYNSCPSTRGFFNEGSNKCISDCTSNDNDKLYHNFDSNICIKECISISNGKKYHKKDENICYLSCKDIPGGNFIYEISEGVCFNDDSLCTYYILQKKTELKSA